MGISFFFYFPEACFSIVVDSLDSISSIKKKASRWAEVINTFKSSSSNDEEKVDIFKVFL